MNARNFVSLAILAAHCCVAQASRTSEKDVLASFEKLESALLALEGDKAQEKSVPFRALEKQLDLHALHLLDAKRGVHESLMFWCEKERCRIAKPDEIEAECERLDALICFLKKLHEFVVLNKCALQEELRAINHAQCNAKRCWYRLQLIVKHSSIGEKSEALSNEHLNPAALEQAILSAQAAIKRGLEIAASSHSSSSSWDTDSEVEQPANYRQIKLQRRNAVY